MTVYDLWLPILLSGLATHILSTLAWMVLPHHKPEWEKLPVEDELYELLDGKNVPPGQYIFPHAADAAGMSSDDYKTRLGKCRGTLILWPEPTNMGAAIARTLAFFFAAAFCIGYLASLALPAGAAFVQVFQFVTTAAVLTHGAGIFPKVFWFREKFAMDLLDKLAFALVTGIIFAATWPGA